MNIQNTNTHIDKYQDPRNKHLHYNLNLHTNTRFSTSNKFDLHLSSLV